MRKFFLVVFLQFFVLALFAQKREPINPQTDKQIIDGFTIQLMPSMDNAYAFMILKDGRPIYVQTKNPFTMRMEGFEKKADAFNVAKWLLKDYKITGRFADIIPPHVAQELKINLNKQQ